MKQWVAESSSPDRNLARKAIKCALDDLKENNQGVLLSTRALKVMFSLFFAFFMVIGFSSSWYWLGYEQNTSRCSIYSAFLYVHTQLWSRKSSFFFFFFWYGFLKSAKQTAFSNSSWLGNSHTETRHAVELTFFRPYD